MMMSDQVLDCLHRHLSRYFKHLQDFGDMVAGQVWIEQEAFSFIEFGLEILCASCQHVVLNEFDLEVQDAIRVNDWLYQVLWELE